MTKMWEHISHAFPLHYTPTIDKVHFAVSTARIPVMYDNCHIELSAIFLCFIVYVTSVFTVNWNYKLRFLFHTYILSIDQRTSGSSL